jgi:glucokinase
MSDGNVIENYYLGFDIGGTKCSVSLGGKDLELHEKIVFSTDVERGPYVIIDELKQNANLLISKYGRDGLAGIGISCGGPLDSKKGVIFSPPNLPGWDAVPIVDILREEFGVTVSLQNDANACALVEWMMGAGRGTRNMIFLTFGTGMGAGLILDGRLYSGTNDLGGEAGHIRLADTGPVGFGKAGSFEGFCSGGGIAQLARQIVADKLTQNESVSFCPAPEAIESITAKTVADYARKGDPVAKKIVEISATYLGKGLAILIDILNPECIVIGSIYSRNEELFKPMMMKVLSEEAIPSALEVCHIVPAALGETTGDYAALCVAVYQDQF